LETGPLGGNHPPRERVRQGLHDGEETHMRCNTLVIAAGLVLGLAAVPFATAQSFEIDPRLLSTEQEDSSGPFGHVFSEMGLGGGSGGSKAGSVEDIRSVDPDGPTSATVPTPTAFGLGIAAAGALGARRRRRRR